MAKTKRQANELQNAFLTGYTRSIVERNYEGLSVPVYLRELGAEDFEKITKKGGSVVIHEDGTRTIDIAGINGGDRFLCSLAMCTDETGETLLFPGTHGETLLANTPLRILRPIASDIREISGLTKKKKPTDPLDDAKND